MKFGSVWSIVLIWSLVATGCMQGGATQPQSSSAQPSGPAGSERPAQPKRLIVASREESTLLLDVVGDGNGDVVEELVSAGLVRFDPSGEAHPLMAEAVPTLENNLVKVAADGRMEISWRLKEGLKWQDGAPLTTQDLLFAVQLGQDKELPDFGNAAYGSIERVHAPDARTIMVEWKEPYIQYDRLFSWQVALPQPRHLLEDAYLNNKANFTRLRFWSSDEFVHAGPFRVRQFLPGERLMLEANPDYALGRPKLDEVEVRFIPDANTFIANIIGGEVQYTIGSDTTVGQAKQAADRWQDGKMQVYPFQSVRVAVPQFMNPDPPVQLDIRFRRALSHGFDRAELNELINLGVVPPPANFMLAIGSPEFPQVKDSIVEYAYDPRRSAQLIEEMGYTRMGDTYQDAGGNPLAIAFLEMQGGAEEQAVLFMLDSWKRIGINGIADIRAARAIDREVRATRPGLTLNAGSFNLVEPRRLQQWFHGSETPTAENRFRGNNRSRYVNPELDILIDRFFGTLQRQPRLELMKQIAHHMTDNAVVIGAYHLVYPALVNNRVEGVTPRTGFSQAWNSHQWDLRS